MAKNLNKQQQQAVEYREGPLLIIAGAGTGKTTVITERIVNLINNNLAKPEEILALTFTEKASQEMEERVDVALPLGYNQMWISTFHSFCDRILRDHGIHIGLDPKFTLLTQAQAIKLIRDNIFEFDLDYFRPLGNPTKFVQGLLTHFSRLQDENVKPEDYVNWTRSRHAELVSASKASDPDMHQDDMNRELANAYQFYTNLKIKNSFLDFGDLIVRALELFSKRPNVLKKYQQKFKFILIDEFQDTNFAQNLLAMQLAGKKGNITVVGDDDQSVYKFRGASVSNIVQFRENFPEAQTIVLNQNYRSLQAILDLSYDVIQNNNPDRLEVKENIDKKLKAFRKGKAEIKLIHTKTGMQEAEEVAEKIIELTKNKYDFKDIAVLVRANNHADIFVKTFERLGIPHQFLGPAKLFQQPEIVDLISYLRVVYNPHDNLSLTRLLSIDSLNIAGRQISDWERLARDENKSLFEVIEQEESTHSHSGLDPESIQMNLDSRLHGNDGLLELINNHLERKYKEFAGNLLFEFLQKTGLYEELAKETTEQAVVRANNVASFFEKLKQLESQVDHEGTIQDAVDWIDLTLELGDSPQAGEVDWTTENKVNLLTIHSSKGLEFPVVFLANMVNLRFPGMNRSEQIPIPEDLIQEILPEKDYHLEEERRLFYVGATRAKDKLFFTASDYYGDAKRAKKLSQFVIETGVELSSRTSEAGSGIYLTEPILKQVQDDKLSVNKLSYSQIESFKICPLHYKLGYILRVPTPPSASLSLGNAVHESMLDIFSELNRDKKLKNIDFEDVLSKNWQNRGFLDKKHEKQAKGRALGYINDYFESEYKGEKPLHLEEKFSIKIDPSLTLAGKIDRVDELADGKIEIIDYKTGSNIPSQREVDKNLQLSIYALAASDIYKIKPEKIILSLYYFEKPEKISTTRNLEQLNEAKLEIFEVRDEIEKSDFKCSNHFFCQSCEYALFCKQEEK